MTIKILKPFKHLDHAVFGNVIWKESLPREELLGYVEKVLAHFSYVSPFPEGDGFCFQTELGEEADCMNLLHIFKDFEVLTNYPEKFTVEYYSLML